jgi:hypothetical protein
MDEKPDKMIAGRQYGHPPCGFLVPRGTVGLPRRTRKAAQRRRRQSVSII